MTPLFDTKKTEKEYSKREGTVVTYVKTTRLNRYADFYVDVFHREDAHPEYGSHYFAIYRNKYANDAVVTVVNVDPIIEDILENKYVQRVKDVV
jgi:hypothetical protein